MKHPLLTALLLAATLALPARALDLDQMSDAEREAFRDEVRAYLLENPEIIMEAVAILEERQIAAQAESNMEILKANAEEIFNDGYSWVGGNPDGDITLVEFMDYRCGFCRRAVNEVNTLLETDGNIRLIIKEYPILGEESALASRFAIATQQLNGDEAYKDIHDALLAFTGRVSATSLSRIADSLGLDADDIVDHMNSDQVSEVIAQNRALAQRLSIGGTPSFVMENQLLRGYLPAQDLLRVAEEIRTQ